MYVCICNALNENKVRAALDGGATKVGQIYRHHGCAPRCGKCVPTMRQLLGDVCIAHSAEIDPAAA